ncbi:MAG: hypothetical protein ACTSRZ_17910 [Promethearchaeota archaeon]
MNNKDNKSIDAIGENKNISIPSKENTKNNENKSFKFVLDFKSQNAQIFWFFILWGVCFGVGYLFKGKYIYIPFWISELNQRFYTPFYLKDIIDLFFLNIIFPFFAIKTRNLVIKDKNMNNFFPNKKSTELNNGLISKKNFWYVFFLIIFIFGNTSHILINRVNSLVQSLDPNNIYTEAYRFIYFFDEYFGHLVLSIGFLGMATINLSDQIKVKCRNLNILEKICVIFFGLGFGAVFAATLMEGQSTFPILIYYVVILIYLINNIRKITKYQTKNSSKSLWKYPILIFFLLNSIGFILFSIIYGIIMGIKPYYPFFIQIGGDNW